MIIYMDNSDIKCYNNFGVSKKCAFTKLSRKRCRNYAFLGGFGLLFFGYGDKLFGACKKSRTRTANAFRHSPTEFCR